MTPPPACYYCISQERFDEMLLESQDIFEYTDDEAVHETIIELNKSSSSSSMIIGTTTTTTIEGSTPSLGLRQQQQQQQQQRLDHLSLTHPRSVEGIIHREIQNRFVSNLLLLQEKRRTIMTMTSTKTVESSMSTTTTMTTLQVEESILSMDDDDEDLLLSIKVLTDTMTTILQQLITIITNNHNNNKNNNHNNNYNNKQLLLSLWALILQRQQDLLPVPPVLLLPTTQLSFFDPKRSDDDDDDNRISDNNDEQLGWSLLSSSSIIQYQDTVVSFLLALLLPPTIDSSIILSFHPMCHDLKLVLGPTWFDSRKTDGYCWYQLLHQSIQQRKQQDPTTSTTMYDHSNDRSTDADKVQQPSLLRIRKLLQLAHILCNGCEDNKRAFVQAGLVYPCIENGYDDDNENDDRNNNNDANARQHRGIGGGGTIRTGLTLLMECIPTWDVVKDHNVQDDDVHIDLTARPECGGGDGSVVNVVVHPLIVTTGGEVCRLIAVLCKFQPLTEKYQQGGPSSSSSNPPVVSSAHANVKELHRVGVLPKLFRLAKSCLKGLLLSSSSTTSTCQVSSSSSATTCLYKDEDTTTRRSLLLLLLTDALSALRVMAIDNDIVQNMIALGILDTILPQSLAVQEHEQQVQATTTTATTDTTTVSSLSLQQQEGGPTSTTDNVVTDSSEGNNNDDNNVVAGATLPSLSSSSSSLSAVALATACLGLIRNLCANDEVKTTICKSSLLSILHLMQKHLIDTNTNIGTTRGGGGDDDNGQDGKESMNAPGTDVTIATNANGLLQEHGCGILAAMALRQPHNAEAICTAQGHVAILDAMRKFPDRVPLQRQGCLAIRNIASRLSETDKVALLDAGAEGVLNTVAGRHQGSVDEAYAALRDLGCNPVMVKFDQDGERTISGTQMFGSGTVRTNFRPVYE